MKKRENFNIFLQNLLTSQEPNSDTFRKNILWYLNSSKDITLADISEKADIPLGTLNSFLYGKTKDINLSNALKLSLALGISVDELAGSLIIDKQLKECINTCRNMNKSDMSLIFWYVQNLNKLNSNLPINKQYVSVMQLACNHHGNLKLTTNYIKSDISHIDDEFKSKIFFGISMPCEHYLPIYNIGDILLIANDRPPKANEHVIIQRSNCLFIARQIIENGHINYYSIRDGKLRTENEDVDYIGYVVGTLKPNGRFEHLY